MSSAVRRGIATNAIRGRCVGRKNVRLSLYVNGALVAEATDRAGLRPGEAGVFTDAWDKRPTPTFEFDNLLLRRLAP